MTGTRSLLLLAGFGFASLLHAAIIYSDFGPGQTYDTSLAADVGTDPNNPIAVQVSTAASFTPAFDSILTGVDFAAYLASGPDQLTVYLTSGALPGAPIESFSVSVPSYPGSVLTLTSVLQPELFAGTTYWIVLEANDPVNSLIGWYGNSIGATPGFLQRFGAGSWFLPGFEPPVFDVQGTSIPEPSTFLLVSVSLLLFGMRRGARRLS